MCHTWYLAMAASKASTSTVSSHADSILQRHYFEQEHETPQKLPNLQSNNTNQSRGFIWIQYKSLNPNPSSQYPRRKEKYKGPRAFL